MFLRVLPPPSSRRARERAVFSSFSSLLFSPRSPSYTPLHPPSIPLSHLPHPSIGGRAIWQGAARFSDLFKFTACGSFCLSAGMTESTMEEGQLKAPVMRKDREETASSRLKQGEKKKVGCVQLEVLNYSLKSERSLHVK